jgi:hypothetical protein
MKWAVVDVGWKGEKAMRKWVLRRAIVCVGISVSDEHSDLLDVRNFNSLHCDLEK